MPPCAIIYVVKAGKHFKIIQDNGTQLRFASTMEELLASARFSSTLSISFEVKINHGGYLGMRCCAISSDHATRNQIGNLAFSFSARINFPLCFFH
jgi:hypothetical protein